MVLVKKARGMIDLGVLPDKGSMIAEAPGDSKANKPSYPSVYIDKDIGLEEQDAGEMLKGLITFKVKRVSKEVNDQGKTIYSCSLEIRGLKINRG